MENSPLERVGFILADEEIVEVQNVCEKPEAGFRVRGEDLIEYADRAVATFHTHPDGSSNLSIDDHRGFLNWPKLQHWIIGKDGIGKYQVKDGAVVRL